MEPNLQEKGCTVIHGGDGRAQEDRARTPNIFHGPASLVHLVLLGDTTAHEVHVTRSVPFHLQLARLERPLLADEDMEVVVGGVKARVTLRAEWRAKDDEVLGDARVDDVHRAHRTAGVVEHPFGAVRVERHVRVGVGGGEIGEDVRDHARCVVGRYGERGELQLVEMDRVENIPSILGVKKKRVGRLRERESVCVCANLDRVEPAERRKRDEQVDGTRNPLCKRVALWTDIILIWSRGGWGR